MGENFLYVIGSGKDADPVKVGVASDVNSRLLRLQAGSPFKLAVLFSVELKPNVVRKAEAACHVVLRPNRTHGEWFAVSRERAIEVATEVIASRPWEQKKVPKKRGDPRPDNLGLRLPPGMKDAMKAIAASERRTLTSWVEHVLAEAIERRQKPN